jgi:hypothetical protein
MTVKLRVLADSAAPARGPVAQSGLTLVHCGGDATSAPTRGLITSRLMVLALFILVAITVECILGIVIVMETTVIAPMCVSRVRVSFAE